MKTLERIALDVINEILRDKNGLSKTIDLNVDCEVEFLRRALSKLAEGVAPVAKINSKFGDPESFGEREVEMTADLMLLKYGELLYPATAIAAAQQQAAEACASFLETLPWRVRPISSGEAASEIRSGEWRKYLNKGENNVG